MPLPPEETKEWRDLIAIYPTSNIKVRDKLAKDYGYGNRINFQTVMQRRNIFIDQNRIEPVVTTDYKLPPDASWEEHLRIINEMNQLVDSHQKVPTELSINYDTQLPIALTHSADWQLGQFGVDYDSFKTDMETIISEPGLYCDVGGDAWQNIIQASKIGSSHNQTPIPVQLALTSITLKMLKKAKKLNTLRTGNHSHWSTSLTGEDWLGETSKRMNLIYTKHGARVNLKVGTQDYPYMARHVGRFNSSFNPTHSNKQEQRLNYPWARFTAFEHHHVASMEQYRYDDKECVAIRTGTYAIYDDHAQQWGYYGAHVCNPTVVLFPDKDRLVGFKDMYDAIDFLRAVRQEYAAKVEA